MINKIKKIILAFAVASVLIGGVASASTITLMLGSDTLTASRSVINTNFTNLNTDKVELSNSVAWTVLQKFFANASTTGFSANYASIGQTATTTISNIGSITIPASSLFSGAGLATCNGTNQGLTWSAGLFGCSTDAGFDNWTHPATNVSATTTLVRLDGQASTTQLSIYQKAYIGGTSTTTIDSTGNIVIPSGSSLTNTGVSNGCGTWSSGVLGSTGLVCGSGGGGTTDTTKFATSSDGYFLYPPGGFVTIGTTTARLFPLVVSSSTVSQLSLGDGLAGNSQFTFRTAGNNFYISTTTAQGLATSSVSVLTVSSNGYIGIASTSPGSLLSIGTLNGINFGTATSTFGSAVNGINITTGCYAISGTCLSSGVKSLIAGTNITLSPTSGLGDVTVNCPLCLTTYDSWTHAYTGHSATSSMTSFGTTTARFIQLTVGSSTVPQLSLSDNTAGDSQFVFRAAGNTFALATTTTQGLATSTQNILTVNTNGYVGISSTSPGSLFSINSVVNFDPATTSFSSVGGINLKSGCFSIAGVCLTSGVSSIIAGTNVTISPTNGLGAVTISSSGSDPFTHAFTGQSATSSLFAIGTTTSQIFQATIGSSTVPQLSLSDNTVGDAQWVFRNAGQNLYISTTTAQGLATSTTAAMTLSATGKPGVGISTSTANAALTVETRAGDYSNSFFIGSSSEYFRVDNGGKIYAPNTTLQGGAATDYWCYDANSQFVRVSAVCTVSALKFKKDIHNLDVGLADLLKLRPVSYFKRPEAVLGPDDTSRQMGLVADEVAKNPKLNEMLVTYDSNGQVHGFRYDQFTALLTKSIQELNTKVDNLSVGKMVRSVEENWQDIFIALLLLGFIYQQYQIRELKKK